MARAHRTTARDFSGAIVGRLTAIEPTDRRSGNNVVWRCRCSCGTETFVHTGNLATGKTRSCGCWKRDRNFRHGATTHRSMSPEYSVWASMLRRCTNPKNPRFSRYGGRGITVCERWKDFASFIADMGPRPEGPLTIERLDNDGPYSPENCRWASYREQSRNTSQNRLLTLDGVTLCLQDWCVRLGLTRNAVNARLRSGWSVERILTTPLHRYAPRVKRQSMTSAETS